VHSNDGGDAVSGRHRGLRALVGCALLVGGLTAASADAGVGSSSQVSAWGGVLLGDCNLAATGTPGGISVQRQEDSYGASGPGSSGVTRWGAALTITQSMVSDYLDDSAFAKLDDPSYWYNCWNPYLAQHPGQQIAYGLPMMATTDKANGATLARGAAGAYDSHFVNLARSLIAHNSGRASLRLGYEFNCDCSRWAADRDPVSWVRFYRRIVAVMRAQPGAHFSFLWNVNNGYNNDVVKGGEFDARTVFPDDPAVDPASFTRGTTYVDMVTDDIYDQNYQPQGYPFPPGATASDIAARQQFATQQALYGGGGEANPSWDTAAGWRAFARRWGKRFGVSEWGLIRNPNQPRRGLESAPALDPNGGGDNPYFIDGMARWFAHADPETVSYAAYFDTVGSTDNRIDAGFSPLALARLEADLGNTVVPVQGTKLPRS